MNPHYDITQKTLNYMAPDPPAEAVNSIVEILSLSHDQAAVLLKKNNNDVSRCMEAYFADPTGALTEDKSAREWEDQDNIPFADDSSTGAMPALSRPPSRADNRNSNYVDLSHTHAQATALDEKGAQDDEMNDPEMQRAINLSLGRPEMAEQETGVTGSGQQFGPAMRKDYHPSEWGMVQLPVATSRELIEHPLPSKRRRINGQPAFLRPSPDTGYLAALLTIYHSIPLAREALLLPAMRATSYGYDPAWWSGSSDENRKSISMEIDEYRDQNTITVLAEVQCLMAFLDNTQRAYGGVDALSDLHFMQSYQRTASTPFSAFLEAWGDAASSQHPQEQLPRIFRSEAMKTTEPGSHVTKEMVCVEPQVIRRPGQTLVNLLDSTVWDDTPETLDDVWISHAGEIFTIRLFDSSPTTEGLLLTAPPVWYPDRYMSELREQTREMRMEVQEIQKHIYTITSQQRHLQSFMRPGRKPVRAREVLEAAAKAAQTILQDRDVHHSQNEDLNIADVSVIEGHIRAVVARIDEKTSELEGKKTVLQAQIDELELKYTEPGNDPSQPPRLKYVLQGVATRPDIMYIRRRNQDLLGLESGADDERTEWKWWRISWSPPSPSIPVIGPVSQAQTEAALQSSAEANDGLPYAINEVSEADVIEAAKTEHHSVVLVYASQAAVDFEGSALTQSLKKFVEQDNINFGKELREEFEKQHPQRPQEQDVEIGSTDSGFASQQDLGLSSSSDEERPKTGTTTTTTTTTTIRAADREMTPMSYRGEDGQPSPKRPKSSDNSTSHWGGIVHDDNIIDASPPSYEETFGAGENGPEMQEKQRYSDHRQSKIGQYAEALMERYGNGEAGVDGDSRMGGTDDTQQGETVHIERAGSLPR